MRVVVVVLTVCCAGCPTRPATPIEPIKLGVLMPLSGDLQGLGPSWEDAARLAAEDVNAGGGLFDGRPLELIFEDSGTDHTIATAAARKLVSSGVVGLIGPGTSGESTQVLADVAKPAEIPMISCCATATELTSGNPPNGGFFFRTTPSDKLQGKALAFIAKTGIDDANVLAPPCPNAAFMFRNDAYGSGFQQVFQAEYEGATISGSTQHGTIAATGSYGAPDHEASLAEIQDAAVNLVSAIDQVLSPGVNPEMCIVVISFDVDGAPAIAKIDDELQNVIAARTAANASFRLTYHYLVGDGANSGAFATGVGALGTKILGTVPFHATNAAYDEFVKAYRARFEETDEPIAFTAQTYDAVFLMALAITEAKSTVGKDIRNKLYPVSGAGGGSRFEGAFFGEVANAVLAGDKVDYVGPSGEATFDAFGDVVGDYVLWQVVGDGNGAFVVTNREPLLASTFNP